MGTAPGATGVETHWDSDALVEASSRKSNFRQPDTLPNPTYCRGQHGRTSGAHDESACSAGCGPTSTIRPMVERSSGARWCGRPFRSGARGCRRYGGGLPRRYAAFTGAHALALEELENHLSPYLLARLIRQVRSLIDAGDAQVIITSHSPAVLSRVNPREVRYCRCAPKTRVSTLKKIKIPPGIEEASKFVRGAMLAYPELYFARFVLLVEGVSERIVLPPLADVNIPVA